MPESRGAAAADLGRARESVAEEGLGGWLFCNQFHKDPIADRVLGIPADRHNSRPWLYLLRPEGPPLKLVHSIEAGLLDHLPGDRRVYESRARFEAQLREMAALVAARADGKQTEGGREVGCQFSEELPSLSYLDHGMAGLLQRCGFRLRSSAALVQRLLGVLSPAGIASHERAAAGLYRIVAAVWKRLGECLREGEQLGEGAVRDWILDLFEQQGLESDSSPIVAAAENSADPHYEPQGPGAPLRPGAVLQLDLWARERASGSIYADISWVGVLGPAVPEHVGRAFTAVRQARELAVAFIAERCAANRPAEGREVDQAVREFLQQAGYGQYLRHRTGHAIDERVHGFGANLDSIEFPDRRLLLEGACFSVEPGVYLPDLPGSAGFGVRTEVDVYVADNRPVISGGPPQREPLLL